MQRRLFPMPILASAQDASLSASWNRRGYASRSLATRMPGIAVSLSACCRFANFAADSATCSRLPIRPPIGRGGYVRRIRCEAEQVRDALQDASFTRLAIGGGTPTFLQVDQLAALLQVATGVMGARPKQIPVSIEASPATATDEKLSLLREFGVDRLSLGVQTFDEQVSVAAWDSHKKRVTLSVRFAAVRAVGFPVLNLDLIYGGEGQTLEGWLVSVRTAIEYRPEELYLYPLYVRALTGLGGQQHSWHDQRPLLYAEKQELLLSTQPASRISLQIFKTANARTAKGQSTPASLTE